MNVVERKLAELGVAIPEVLIPAPGINLEKWAVIACDQFTQDKNYWKEAAAFAGEEPSALRVILPEVYLDSPDKNKTIEKIQGEMAGYLAENSNIFRKPRRACIYVERDLRDGATRRGLILAIDLDSYEWRSGNKAVIRATEGTVPSRLPPRMEIRRNAALETPHVMLLLDDADDTLLTQMKRLVQAAGKSGAAGTAGVKSSAYDTNLMLGGGHIHGWYLAREEEIKRLAQILGELYQKSADRYGSPFLFALGDGNHSLAAAKAVWDEYKAEHAGDAGLETHPLRWAMVEVVNLYDKGLIFEPIHRFVAGVTIKQLLGAFNETPGFSAEKLPDKAALEQAVNTQTPGFVTFGIVSGGEFFLGKVPGNAVATVYVEPVLDKLRAAGGVTVDYIHGSAETFALSADANAAKDPRCGILLPPIDKSGLFETVAKNGALPRKSFSMGNARDKRYYLECRALKDIGHI
jgi:uncharacterized protein (DUF1015 family)